MKIKTINRSEESWTRERSQDVQKVYRNLDPSLHPMEKAVEYTRALKAGDYKLNLSVAYVPGRFLSINFCVCSKT